MDTTFNKYNTLLFLMIFNVLAPLFSFFGYHNLYLFSIIFPGFYFICFFFLNLRNRDALNYSSLIIIMFVASVWNINIGFGYFISMANDLATTGLFILPFYLGKFSFRQLKLFFLGLYAVSFSIFFFIIYDNDLSGLFGVSDRDLVYKELLSLASFASFNSAIDLTSILAFCLAYTTLGFLFMPFFLNSIDKKSYYLIIVLAILQFLIYEILTQKRQNVVEFGLIYAFALTLTRKLYPKSLFSNWIFRVLVLFVLLSVFSKSEVVATLFERFRESSRNISEFDRLEEARDIFSEYNLLNYFVGNGFGWLAQKAVSTGETVHIGYMNLMNKGGLMYVLFYLFQVTKNILYCWKRIKLDNFYFVGITFSIFSFVMLFFAPGYGWYFSSIITGMGMFSRFFINDLVSRSLVVLKVKGD